MVFYQLLNSIEIKKTLMSRFPITLYLFLVFFLVGSATVLNAQKIEKDFFRSHGANSGRCFARSLMPPIFDTIIENVEVKQAVTYVKEIPPVYDTIVEEIMVKPEYHSWEVVPPVFDTIIEKILVREAESYADISSNPNQDELFREVEKSVQLIPSYTRWDLIQYKKDCRSSTPEKDCIEWAPINVPAEYEYLNQFIRRKIARGAEKKVTKPAKYETIIKRVLVKPAELKEVKVLPQYKTVRKLVLKEPRRFQQVTIPAEYVATQQLRLIKNGGYTESPQVLCSTRYDEFMVPIQNELTKLGYDIGEVDGIFGRKTKAALVDFQKEYGLPIGQLDFKTLKELGVIK